MTFNFQISMVILIILGVILIQIRKKKARLRLAGYYCILIGSLIGVALFSLWSLYLIVLLAAFGAAVAVKSIHQCY